jgi:hypothetical protein
VESTEPSVETMASKALASPHTIYSLICLDGQRWVACVVPAHSEAYNWLSVCHITRAQCEETRVWTVHSESEDGNCWRTKTRRSQNGSREASSSPFISNSSKVTLLCTLAVVVDGTNTYMVNLRFHVSALADVDFEAVSRLDAGNRVSFVY